MIIRYYTSKYVGWLIVFNQIVPAIGLCERNDILSVRELLGLKNVKTSKICQPKVEMSPFCQSRDVPFWGGNVVVEAVDIRVTWSRAESYPYIHSWG